MKHAFVFDFVFDDEDPEAEDGIIFSMGFVLNVEIHGEISLESWYEETADEMEEKYGAVHDCFGTSNNDLNIVAFSTYEIPDKATARVLFQEWREAFIQNLGDEAVGPTLEHDGDLSAVLLAAHESEPAIDA